jgi:ubiquinone/menaquinone biosynthesis C-methylase UbiE
MAEQWQLDGTAPELYERYLVPAITSLWAADLVERAHPEAGERVLDIACGTGIVARTASERMGTGRVVGIDINAGMLEVARRARPTGAAVEWFEGSALDLPFRDASFDVVLCQLGLQFFPEKPKALLEMHRVLLPDGRAALSVYTAIENTPIAAALADALDRHLAPGASSVKRSEHALSDAGEVRRLMVEAGFRDVVLQAVTKTIRFASPRDYVRLQTRATPMAALVENMDQSQQNAMLDAITTSLTSVLAAQRGERGLESPQEAFVLTARK